MIISFSVENFLSIRDEQVLSFEATSENRYTEFFIREVGKYKLLKLGALYGANASGKTNILKALDLLIDLVTKSRSADREINFTPFLLDQENIISNCKMTLKFLLKSEDKFIEHVYELRFNQKEIVSEILKFYPSQAPALLFKRVKADNTRGYYLKFGEYSKLKKEEQNLLESSTLNNNTILSSFNKVNPLIPKVKRVRDWFDEFLSKFISLDSSTLNKKSDEFFSGSVKKQQILRQLLIKADYNISNIQITKEKRKLSDKNKVFINQLFNTIFSMNGDSNEKIQSNFAEQLKSTTEIEEVRKGFYHSTEVKGNEQVSLIPYNLESNGTKRSYELSAPLIDSLINDKMIIFDEIESSLHFDLVKFFILVFLANSQYSQMLFTTHNLLLLDWDVLRHDVIWFTEKKNDGSTDLYSLADFNELNRSKVLKRYLSGQFGAIPEIFDYTLDSKLLDEVRYGRKKQKKEN